MPPRGKLIIFEGLDRAGKTTQIDLLLSSLQQAGHVAEKIRFPDRTTAIGQTINTYLTSSDGSAGSSDQAMHLLFSANRWEALPSLLQKLNSGVTLLVDRYSFSGAVYSAAKQIPGMDVDWCWAPEIGLPSPDLVVFLSVTEEVQKVRGGFGGERYENQQMQKAVRQGFGEVWDRWEGRVQRVDADGTVEEVEAEIRRVVRELVKEDDKPLGTLGPLRQKNDKVNS